MSKRRFWGLLGSALVIAGVASLGIQVEGSRAASISHRTIENPRQVVQILHDARRQIRNNAEHTDYFSFRNRCEAFIENKEVGSEFANLNAKLWQAYNLGHYRQCADIATEMEKYLPDDTPNSYTFSQDYRSAWRAQIGDFLAWDNDYEGALREYESARHLEPSTTEKFKKFPGAKHAAYGQAETEALLGQLEASHKHLTEAPKLYWTGCGNCITGSKHCNDRIEAVYDAFNQPDVDAEITLLKLVCDGYVPKYDYLGEARVPMEKNSAKLAATFFLGELYLKQNRTDLAREAFRGAAEDHTSQYGKMAQSRLARL